MSTETWRPVVGFERAYEVSDRGRVRSLSRKLADGRQWRGRILRATPQPSGHLHVSLALDGAISNCLVHRLVLSAFSGPCPEGMEGCHGDGDPTNNALSNLRWGTPSSNSADSVRHGTHENAGRTHCPQDHALEHPNLVAGHARRGWRLCLSCNRERALARFHNRPFDPARADARYAALTKGKAA